MNKFKKNIFLLIPIALLCIVSTIGCVEEQGYKHYEDKSVISQICVFLFVGKDNIFFFWQT